MMHYLAGVFLGGLLVMAPMALLCDHLVRKNSMRAYLHFRKKYNEQLDELCVRYRQERVALIHRYEGKIDEIQREVEQIAYAVDKDKTKKVVS